MKLKRILCFCYHGLFIISLFFPSQASSDMLIVKDDDKAKKLSINYESGKAVINIETNDIRGISHNYYSDFNVDEKGVVFNNAKEQYVTTIINEVTSKNKTMLKGDLSINGNPVSIVIANPNGIHCQGCSFNGIETVTLINGRSDNLNLGKYRVSNKGSIEFSTGEEAEKNKFIFDKINIISKDVKFNENLTLFSNKLNIINGKQIYHMYNKFPSKYHKGKLLLDFGSIINVKKFIYSAGNNVFINNGILNVGEIVVDTKGKIINSGEINILNWRIDSIFKNVYEKYSNTDFSEKNTIFNAKTFSNEKNSRLTIYKTNVYFNLSKGNFFNNGSLRLEKSKISANVRNYIHSFESKLFNINSLMVIDAEKRVMLNGEIFFIDSLDKIFIQNSTNIRFNPTKSDNILIKH
ncbi:filamentous hemagglutinin N-terminal domain-containing protein [Proteus faecis]|uniref:Filamentous hemagglutinin N-terminal domain-containing protein n=2 Tax=Proteus faecis TaxID=2050967 RepID=A0AAW7CSC0_9GAMM|nr:filamentous hemagglutinin N-terminal domain-containing protein [Proteus faecis]MBG3012297.1 filamentous hemagglutinin N-terminal domain-containing protein [Proteus mirabilis]MDL5166734.1 filamentous hemagglutinin N-terminal domain-containing protein [Proteus faecis]MDL5274631.1 filamentous hemagglutinin N-terminal domain-containing protein [Proteus faecis]MDL5278288.1 filamentous hemagglutinin N-terminal domain-containing protein [Proteus faecis]MDL5307290.1 filamentous hemagglutinin N-term